MDVPYIRTPLRRPELTQAFLAASMLLLGALIYLFGRSSKAYFVPEWLYGGGNSLQILGGLSSSLPSFSHTFAFTLFTTAVLWPWRSLMMPICFFWFSAECLLEVGQINVLANHIIRFIPDWFHRVPILEVMSRYFVNGTFDLWDIGSIALGSLSAYSLILVLRKREVCHETHNR
jgi:hypothetical protein